MHKHPQGHFQWALQGKNQFLVITFFTAITIVITFFYLKLHPTYHEILSKDGHRLCILSGILQPNSIPHLVQYAESHDIIGSGKGKRKQERKEEGRWISSFHHLQQYCFFSSRTDHTQQPSIFIQTSYSPVPPRKTKILSSAFKALLGTFL